LNQTLPDLELPIFVYGSLKSDEIAWPQISNFVSQKTPEVLRGFYLQISDGIAYATQRPNYSVHGELLHFSSPVEAYEVISQFEGTRIQRARYKWIQVEVGGLKANMLEATNKNSRAVESSRWSLNDDDVFSKGIPWLHREISICQKQLKPFLNPSNKTDDYWDHYFRLQAAVLFLWGVQERLELFRLGITDDSSVTIGSRRITFSNDKLFKSAIQRAGIDKSLKIYSYRTPGEGLRSADFNALTTWAQVRNNISHHAKGSEKEVLKVLTAAVDHFNTLFMYLTGISPRLADSWTNLTPIEKEL
jgi:gamma-glutamylcyclotransferase (GGCT)/AIG2-like uncharacterized protein YtfP